MRFAFWPHFCQEGARSACPAPKSPLVGFSGGADLIATRWAEARGIDQIAFRRTFRESLPYSVFGFSEIARRRTMRRLNTLCSEFAHDLLLQTAWMNVACADVLVRTIAGTLICTKGIREFQIKKLMRVIVRSQQVSKRLETGREKIFPSFFG